MNVLLVNTSGGFSASENNITISNDSSVFPPLGLEYLGASLINQGHNVKIIDYGMETYSKDRFLNELKTTDVVGMSVQMDNVDSVALISEIIHEADSDIPILIGGSNCSFLKKNAIKDVPYADICCECEGEKTIGEIMNYLEGKQSLSEIPGIYFRENGSIKSGKPFQLIKDLDEVSFPARHLVEKYEYGKFMNCYPFRRKFTSLLSSRGCPHKCRFCTRYSNVIKGYGYRERSAENVVEEIELINEKYGSVMIVDDNFLANVKRAHKIADLLIERKTDIDLLVMGARVDTAKRDLYEKLKKAGVKYLGFGIESGNQDVLDYYNKKITLDQIRNAVNLGSEMGFLLSATFILGAPIETKQHFENTIDFACSLPLDMAFFGPLLYQMGSDMWNEAVEKNLISKSEYQVPTNSKRGLGNFTPEELQIYVNKAFRRFYVRPLFLIDRLYRAFERKDFGLPTRGFHYIMNSIT